MLDLFNVSLSSFSVSVDLVENKIWKLISGCWLWNKGHLLKNCGSFVRVPPFKHAKTFK